MSESSFTERPDLLRSLVGQFRICATANILPMTDLFKMVWTYAAAVSAQVVKFHLWKDTSPLQEFPRMLVGKTRSRVLVLSDPENSIPTFVGRLQPNPARRCESSVFNRPQFRTPDKFSGMGMSSDVSPVFPFDHAPVAVVAHDHRRRPSAAAFAEFLCRLFAHAASLLEVVLMGPRVGRLRPLYSTSAAT